MTLDVMERSSIRAVNRATLAFSGGVRNQSHKLSGISLLFSLLLGSRLILAKKWNRVCVDRSKRQHVSPRQHQQPSQASRLNNQNKLQ
jgi:hypothetical protein